MPATVPVLQILYRREGDILFGWKPLPRTQAKAYNLYACATPTGVYTIVQQNILNEPDKTIYSGKVLATVKDSSIPIPPNPYIDATKGNLVQGTLYWFKLTYIDPSNLESNIALSPAIIVRPANEAPLLENEAKEANQHIFGWVEERHRWEKILLDADGKLQVDATVDVTLGNVKVAARPDGTTLEYLLVDNNRELIARIDPNSISRINDYEETLAVVKNVETTILTYSNLSDFFIEKIACSGTGDAVFKFKINGATKQTLRSSWNNRNPTFDFSAISRKMTAGDTVTITATHVEQANQNFESSLIGFTFTI